MPRKSVVVTGASTGIGRASVAELARLGYHVWAAVRTDRDDKELRNAYPDAVSVLRLDLTDAASIETAGRLVYEAGPLHGLVNNAGVALPGPLEFMPIDVFRRQIEVNLVGQLALTQAMLPALRLARADGADSRIVMVGSIGGRVAGPLLGAYHAAKFGLAGMTDSLRAELAPFGIRVILIEPGSVSTPMWQRGRAAADELVDGLPPIAQELYGGQVTAARKNAVKTAARGIPPARAAAAVVRALTAPNPTPRKVVGRDARAAAVLGRLLPYRLLYRVVAGNAASG